MPKTRAHRRRGRPSNGRKVVVTRLSVSGRDSSVTLDLEVDAMSSDEEEKRPKNEQKVYSLDLKHVIPDFDRQMSGQHGYQLIPVVKLTTDDLRRLDRFLDGRLPPLSTKEADESGFKSVDHFKTDILSSIAETEALRKKNAEDEAVVKHLTEQILNHKQYEEQQLFDVKGKRWCERDGCVKEVTDFDHNTDIDGTNEFGIAVKRRQYFCSRTCLTEVIGLQQMIQLIGSEESDELTPQERSSGLELFGSSEE